MTPSEPKISRAVLRPARASAQRSIRVTPQSSFTLAMPGVMEVLSGAPSDEARRVPMLFQVSMTRVVRQDWIVGEPIVMPASGSDTPEPFCTKSV